MRPIKGNKVVDDEGNIIDTGYKTPPIKRINDKHRRVGRLVVKGHTYEEIKEMTGFSCTHISRIVSNPTVQNEMERFKTKLSDRALDKIIAATPDAADVLIDDINIKSKDPRLRKLRQSAALSVLEKADVGAKRKEHGDLTVNQQYNTVNISDADLLREVLDMAGNVS